MTDRAIFNRRYTSFAPGGQQVWLVNGTSVTTSASTTQGYTAGAALIQGAPVYVSGTFALPATAASGISATRYNVIGFATESVSGGSGVAVVLDDTAIIGSANLVGETQLTPGRYYYLAKYPGQITQYATASGTVTASGGYGALVTVGLALSTTELQVEIEPPVTLTA